MRRDRQLVAEFVQAYNYVHGSSFCIESWPEEDQRNTPAVEAIARDGTRLMAIEHTLAQPFVGERQDSAIFRRGPVHEWRNPEELRSPPQIAAKC